MDCALKFFFITLFLLQIYAYKEVSYTFPLALPNCQDHCGATSVPYPFGIGQDCYKNKWFEILCTNSLDQGHILFLPSIQRQVISFNLGSAFFLSVYTKFYIQSPMQQIGSCFSGSSGSSYLNLTSSPFHITQSNMFTAVGCNSKAIMNAAGFQIVGCKTTCGNEISRYEEEANTSCVGYKCCQMTIPPNLQEFNATIEKLVPTEKGCQVAFLSQSALAGSLFRPPGLSEYSYYTTMELEWRLNLSPMTSESCLCKNNTHLEDRYQCSCKAGYIGNPYIPGGCQDIDECSDPRLSKCGKNKCVNVPGSFRCEKTWLAVLGGSLISGLLLLVIVMWLLYNAYSKWKVARQKRKFFRRNGGLLLEQQASILQGSVNRTKLFTSDELEKATDRFNASRILGQGGQGTVYKGMLEDGTIVAVKKSKALEEENLEEFINEIILLSQINHRNVVKILGCCLETEVPVLVYEFIPNRNLFDHLQDPSEDFPMTWKVRHCIACDVADALSYLHSAASIPIYHRDVKSTNILLDEKHRAKVSDFGISRSVPIDDTHLTTVVQGTIGYVDPEYLQSNHFTGKSDVYSFGVVLIELLTGGRPVSLLRPQEVRMLGAYFLEAMRNETVHDIIDARIKEECDQEEVIAVANLARRCLSLNSVYRPTMRDAFIELDRMRSKKKTAQSQEQNSEEEHTRILMAVPDSISLSYSSPDLVVDDMDSKPLMLHKTQ